MSHRCLLTLATSLALTPFALGSDLFHEILTLPTGGQSFFQAPNVEVLDLDGDGLTDIAFPVHTGANADDVAVVYGQPDGSLALGAAIDVGRPITRARFGDLDGDGHLDLVATVSGIFDILFVRLADGAGGFATAMTYGLGDDPRDVVLGDLDGDGHLDAVTVNSNAATASVLLNDGTGSFAPATHYAVGALARGVALGDVDGDGDLDLAVANRNDGDISLLLNDGAGGFSFAKSIDMPPLPGSVELADLDNDGQLDLIVGCDQGDTISVRLGHGDATFGSASTTDVGGPVRELAVFDIDEDGDLDLAMRPGQGDNGLITVLLGVGDGSFGERRLGDAGLAAAVGVGDLNGDGDLDLVTASNGNGQSVLTILHGNGLGAFEPLLHTSADAEAADIAFGDLDGDGRDDLVATDWGQNRVRVHAGVGNGLFGDFVETSFGDRPSLVDLADFDGDGQLDAVVGNRALGTDSLGVLLGDGALGFGSSIDLGSLGDMSDLAAHDLDGDGDTDVLAMAQSEFSVYLNDGAANFAAPVLYTSMACFSSELVYADLTGDGLADVAVKKRCFSTDPDFVQVWPGAGDGTFGAPIDSQIHEHFWAELVAGDLDGDGDLDLLGTGVGEDYVPLLNDGAGAFSVGTSVVVPGDTPRGAALADLDGDGHLDIAGGEHFSTGGNVASVVIAHGNGDGTFGAASEVRVVGRMDHVRAHDFTGDGVPDLVVIPQSGDNLQLMRNLQGPWQNEGFPHAGEQGLPRLVGEGTLLGGEPITLTLSDWRSSGAASWYLGLGGLFAPFKGGTFVPTPDVVLTPFFVDATGDVSFGLTWPTGLSGLTLWMQFWGADPAASHGFAASNGLRLDVP